MYKILVALIFLAGCTQLPTSPTSPDQQPTSKSVEKPGDNSAITDIVSKASQCTQHEFKDRGRGGIGYFKGIALVYARAVCDGTKRSDVKIVSNGILGDVKKDAITHYGMTPTDPLKQVYTLLIGLGMRESSGKYCTGRDMSADYSSANSAEAGLFQASWGPATKYKELADLLPSGRSCHLETFQEKTGTCHTSDAKNWGDGQGYLYQKKAKECPAFATEYAATLLRLSGGSNGEFGPIRRKTAEYVPACESMLDQVKSLVTKRPELCQNL